MDKIVFHHAAQKSPFCGDATMSLRGNLQRLKGQSPRYFIFKNPLPRTDLSFKGGDDLGLYTGAFGLPFRDPAKGCMGARQTHDKGPPHGFRQPGPDPGPEQGMREVQGQDPMRSVLLQDTAEVEDEHFTEVISQLDTQLRELVSTALPTPNGNGNGHGTQPQLPA